MLFLERPVKNPTEWERAWPTRRGEGKGAW
jgi:hypothetical protein